MALKLIIKHHKADYYKFYHGSPQAKKKHYQSLANNNLCELVFGCYFIVLIFIEILMYYTSFRHS